MDIFRYAQSEAGLSRDEIDAALREAISGRELKRVLILPPDFTRFHSNAGLITCLLYRMLTQRGCAVDVMPALGTHEPLTRRQAELMLGDIPYESLLVHNWRSDVVKLGEVPADYFEGVSEGLWHEPVSVEVNRRVMDESYDLIISPGQVVPHEVIGMSNHSKNLFVGVGGSDMINKSHMIGALYGVERMMGRDHSPVRRLFDYGLEHFLSDRPIMYMLTVCTAPGGEIHTHGLFIGEDRKCLEAAIKLSQEKNIDYVDGPVKKFVVYLDPMEFKTTWVGNKSIYRTRMAIADGGELLVLAPGIIRFGEDAEVDRLIRKYGYCGTRKALEYFNGPGNKDLRRNMGAAAHLIHGSTDDRFSVTYAVSHVSREEVEGVGFGWADYEETARRYDPAKLSAGYNTMPDGERIYYVPNPALGLWIDRQRFK